ncbi:hypothetical protein KIN34_01030 [Cellulomonas sp. DKR-3]|uniref:Uncharacterized protein n=1 Tax=Cellulomonas fulva TaxID=2835530 RepID=A0ABS5TUS4_9CELL|nr:hypothetical protein [Cellulomonas fulva]MBT0992874.1 hypothetical protein [Cellulomonas fulva]
MSITDTPRTADVAAYAAQVRTALADLGTDQVDELTDGLEADLAEALADAPGAGRPAGTLAELFGTPAEYAAELRSAAGLAAPGAPRRRTLDERVRARGARAVATGTELLKVLRATRWWPPTEDFLVALRPVWWLLRGWALTALVLTVIGGWRGDRLPLPATGFGYVLLLVLVVTSVQWGRGRWRARERWNGLLMAVSVLGAFAAAVLVITLPWVQERPSTDAYSAPWVDDGVVVGGEYATDLFVYDASGAVVDGAQVFDQAGRPVTLGANGSTGPWYSTDGLENSFRNGGLSADGAVVENAYPLRSYPVYALDEDAYWAGGELVWRTDTTWQPSVPGWPFAAAQPLTIPTGAPAPVPDEGGDATPDADTTEAPDAATSPTAVPDATTTPTAGPTADATTPGDDATTGAGPEPRESADAGGR